MGLTGSDLTRSIPVISGILISIKRRSIGAPLKNSAPDMASSNVLTNCRAGKRDTYSLISLNANGSSSIAMHLSVISIRFLKLAEQNADRFRSVYLTNVCPDIDELNVVAC